MEVSPQQDITRQLQGPWMHPWWVVLACSFCKDFSRFLEHEDARECRGKCTSTLKALTTLSAQSSCKGLLRDWCTSVLPISSKTLFSSSSCSKVPNRTASPKQTFPSQGWSNQTNSSALHSHAPTSLRAAKQYGSC